MAALRFSAFKNTPGNYKNTNKNYLEAIAMEMSFSYKKLIRYLLSNADMVFDRFHAMENRDETLTNQP
ncbi:MAG: transposase [Spongiibacteraceae bacterium]